MTVMTDNNDNLTEVQGEEEVVFEPKVIPDDKLVVTPAAETEEDIKKAINKLNEISGEQPRYKLEDKTDPNVKAMSKAIKSIGGLTNKDPFALSEEKAKEASDGSSADYYKLPEGGTQLQDLISFKNMNAQMGEIFRATYRYGQVQHSEKLRDAKKIRFYIDAEIERLEKYGE